MLPVDETLCGEIRKSRVNGALPPDGSLKAPFQRRGPGGVGPEIQIKGIRDQFRVHAKDDRQHEVIRAARGDASKRRAAPTNPEQGAD